MYYNHGGPLEVGGGLEPFFINTTKAARCNQSPRRTVWAGEHLQLTVSCLCPGRDTGLRISQGADQIIQIVEGQCIVQTGARQEGLYTQRQVSCGCCVIIPAGTWCNLVNVGNGPLRTCTVYTAPQQPWVADPWQTMGAEPAAQPASAGAAKRT